MARIPAGARLEFRSRAESVDITLALSDRHELAPPTTSAAVSVWRGDEFVGAIDMPADSGPVTVATVPGAEYTVFLPDAFLPEVTAVVPHGGTLEPSPARPRWLAYGDSITQGWSASDPALAYPAIAARLDHLDVHNLGFAGAARGEIPVAEHLAATPADVITLAFGTNNWSAIPTGAAHLAAILRDFVSVIRSAQPDTPIVVLSPIIRPDAENRPNVMGASLVQLRSALEATASELAADDLALFLIKGRSLVAPDDLVDGIHPGDHGHRRIADALVPVLDAVLARAGSAPVAEARA
ncbi:SGNH/GDSL hydrolase family protein [Cryptosporangium sp. NPDC051539]|uniref:SGNH/GDSL hydrolase family protein n=1 Tax=Cryptosporangium sp. NPDC051539 TaxID=3363962 RepID=UPI0037883886